MKGCDLTGSSDQSNWSNLLIHLANWRRLTRSGIWMTCSKGVVLRPVFPSLRAEPQLKIEVAEDEKLYHVKAAIPGVKKEDIKVSIDGNQVAISAEVKSVKEEKKGEKVLHSERYYGRQYRAFTPDQSIDEAKAEAKYSDGVLDPTLPKKPGELTDRSVACSS